MDCVICDRQVPAERIRMNPRVRTCSTLCSKVHTRNLRRETARRHYAMDPDKVKRRVREWRERKRKA